MNAAESLICELHLRGVVIEPDGCDKLRVRPANRLRPDEIESIRANKEELLELFACGLRVEMCPGDGCGEPLLVIDDIAYCSGHQMTVRFVESRQ